MEEHLLSNSFNITINLNYLTTKIFSKKQLNYVELSLRKPIIILCKIITLSSIIFLKEKVNEHKKK